MSRGETAPSLDQILHLLDQGMTKADIAQHLGMGRATVFYRLRNAGLSPGQAKPEPKWLSDDEFEKLNKESANYQRMQDHGLGATSLAVL